MKKSGAAILLAGAALLAGCTVPEAQPQTVSVGDVPTAESTARDVLEKLYSAGAQDSADFEEALAQSATNESALNDYLTGKVGDLVTDEGLAEALDNRVVSRVLKAWPASEVTVDEVDLESIATATESHQEYSYTVMAAPEGETLQAFDGNIALTLTDGVWQVTGIS